MERLMTLTNKSLKNRQKKSRNCLNLLTLTILMRKNKF
jgi:hypothetical protein